MDERLAELRSLCTDARNKRTPTEIPRVATMQGEVPEHELATICEPMINLVLQGAKTLTIGNQTLRYDCASCFVMTVELPAVGTVAPDPGGLPYLSVALTLDPEFVEGVVVDAGPLASGSQTGAFSTAPVSPQMLDAWLRLLRLRHSPNDIAVLAPVYEREILYRTLQGPQGWLLRAIATPNAAHSKIRRSIEHIRAGFAQPLAVAELAEAAALSPSAFHRHFKAMTALSPVQFQKRLRLLRARSVLVASGAGVASVGYEVGYDNVSQFTREYKRFFGLPPAADRDRFRRELGARAIAAEVSHGRE